MRLAEIAIRDLGQIEHGDLTPSAEERAQLLVRVDGAAVLRVLQPSPLDIRPELADDLGPRHRAVAHDCSQL